MALLVKKFGGSSVADAECMKRVAKRVYKAQQEGNDVVVVVSAMGKTTDRLIELAREVHARPDDREMDVLLSTGEMISTAILSMALHDLGAEAISMTGSQAGISVDGVHAKAKITEINPVRIQDNLNQGKIVIVAGFQGLTPSLDVATLGRGGSDTTAVALAAVLKADRCQIYTDVEGVYTADPRKVPDAVRLSEISYDEMLELASLGARVLQSRSVEFAKKYGVELEVLTSFEEKPGTLVKEEVHEMEHIVVRGVAADEDQAKVTIQGLPDEPGVAAKVFKELARASINVDMIVQNVSDDGRTDLTFTVPNDDLHKTEETIGQCLENAGALGVSYDKDVAKISIVGVGMRSHAGIAYTMFNTLAEHKVNIQMISTSEIKISVVIEKKHTEKAMQVLHAAFELEKLAADN